jgi:hypothetical protein
VKYIKTVWFFLLPVLFNACGDVVYNNPLDPDASRDELRLLRSVPAPVGGGGDMAHDGEKIWKADPAGSLTAIEPLSGTALRTLSPGACSGVAWYQAQLWLCQGQSNLLRIYDPLSGSLVKTVSTGAYFFRYVTVHGSRLIGWDERSGHLVRFDPESGQGEVLFRPGGLVPGGLAVHEDWLLLAEVNSQSVFLFDWSGQVLAVYRSPVQGLSGICVDPRSGTIYLCTLHGTLCQVALP